jgi:hypothetical protein
VRPPCGIDIAQLFALFVFLPTSLPTERKRERQREREEKKRKSFLFSLSWVRCYPLHPWAGRGVGRKDCFACLQYIPGFQKWDPCARTGTHMDQEDPQRGNLKSTAEPTAPKLGRSKSKRAASARHQRPRRRDRKRHGGRNDAFFSEAKSPPRKLIVLRPISRRADFGNTCSPHQQPHIQAKRNVGPSRRP